MYLFARIIYKFRLFVNKNEQIPTILTQNYNAITLLVKDKASTNNEMCT